MVKLSRAISLVLMYGLLLFGLFWIIIYGFNIIFWGTLALFALGLACYWLIDRMELNDNYKIFIGLAIWLNALAYAYFYHMFVFFGYPVHFVDSILITFILYDYLKKNLKVREIYLYTFVFLTVIGIVSMWEVYEYSINLILHVHVQGVIVSNRFLVYPIDDTMWDIIIGSIGSLLTLGFRKISSH